MMELKELINRVKQSKDFENELNDRLVPIKAKYEKIIMDAIEDCQKEVGCLVRDFSVTKLAAISPSLHCDRIESVELIFDFNTPYPKS